MLGRLPLTLCVASVAGLATWYAMPVETVNAGANGCDVLADSDGDFLPDCVEWVMMTSASSPDTDGDQIGDFVEVVQRGSPRHPSSPLALDEEMRVVVTAPSPGSGETMSWLHLFVRFVDPSPNVSQFSAWVGVSLFPGFQLPFEFFASGPTVFRERVTQQDGYWAQISVPIVSVAFLQTLMPCSFHVEATISGRHIHTAVQLVNLQGMASTIVPFGNGAFAVQSIAPALVVDRQSNKVCLIDLNEVGVGPGGAVYEVIDASCEDCNELECGAACPQSIGFIFPLPGSLSVL